MQINAFTFNPFGEMTYVVWDPASHQAAIVDPGMTTEQERDALDKFIAANKLQIKYLLNTHLHLDHVFGTAHIKNKYGVETSANSADNPLGRDIHSQAMAFGMPLVDGVTTNAQADIELNDGDTIKLGNEDLIVIATPGHSPGSICFYCPQSGFVLTGDTLFRRGVGRTDLQGGDTKALQHSILNKLYTLPDNTLVIPGHGPTTTIGEEKRSNPFF